MSGEIIAFSVISLSESWRLFWTCFLQGQLLTNSRNQFEVIFMGARTSEKRMVLDFAVSREWFRDRVLSAIGNAISSQKSHTGLWNKWLNLSEGSFWYLLNLSGCYRYPFLLASFSSHNFKISLQRKAKQKRGVAREQLICNLIWFPKKTTRSQDRYEEVMLRTRGWRGCVDRVIFWFWYLLLNYVLFINFILAANFPLMHSSFH